MKVILLIVIFILSFRVSATRYYLSGSGNDSQSGTSISSPWRSLQKLSEVMSTLQPGDSILFERGSVFEGVLKITASGKLQKPLYIGDYGSGNKPVISGSKEISHWTTFRGSIWVADCTDCQTEPGDLFIDGHYQSLGRYPNKGYLALSCQSTCNTSFTDPHNSFADGYWDGAEVVVKSSRWTLDNLPVINYSNKTFLFSMASSYPLPNGNGYFIQKHLGTLDQPGEWFFDKKSNKIFMYCANNHNPQNHTVELSVRDVGLEMLKANFVTIENLIFRFQRKTGVQIQNSDHVTLRNCEIKNSGKDGAQIVSCKSPALEHCRIEDSNNNGVEWVNNIYGSFTGNSVLRSGLHPGRGNSGNGTYIGLSVRANNPSTGNNLFQFNSIDSTGYIGIDFRTGGTSIKNNLVSNFCMVKDDGAGIYTWGNTGGDNAIEGNIVLHGIGNSEGTNDPHHVWASGIYIDDRSADLSISNNTVAYCGTNGIYLHNARMLSIQGNTLFANGSHGTNNNENAELCIKRDGLVPTNESETLDLRITENRLVTSREGNHCIYLHAEKEQDLHGLEFDRNQYYARNDRPVARQLDQGEICHAMQEFSPGEWQHAGNDKSSQFKKADSGSNESSGVHPIINSPMTHDINGWMIWPSNAAIVHDKKIGAIGPSLKVQIPFGKNEVLLYCAGLGLDSKKWYRLSFSAMGIVKSNLEFVPMQASAPWMALDDYACFSIDTVFKSYSYCFKPNKGDKLARLNFKNNVTFWIDNVTLSEIEVNPGAKQESLLFVYNATDKPKTILPKEKSKFIDGTQAPNTVVLQPYGSMILQRN